MATKRGTAVCISHISAITTRTSSLYDMYGSVQNVPVVANLLSVLPVQLPLIAVFDIGEHV